MEELVEEGEGTELVCPFKQEPTFKAAQLSQETTAFLKSAPFSAE